MPGKILISGAGGFLGKRIVAGLRLAGREVRVLSRKEPAGDGEFFFDPYRAIIDEASFDGVSAVINLSGESIFGLWTLDKMRRILDSRVTTTKFLSEKMRSAAKGDMVFISASAVGYYGFRREGSCDEESEKGDGFLSDVCSEWEKAADSAGDAARVVNARFGVALGPQGGMLKRVLPLFKWNLGGRIGSGKQPFSWIAADEIPFIIEHILADSTLSGPVNFVSPESADNAGFTRCLASALNRRALFPVPAPAVRVMLGKMGEEMVLGGVSVRPEKLARSGYRFRHPGLEDYLKSVLS